MRKLALFHQSGVHPEPEVPSLRPAAGFKTLKDRQSEVTVPSETALTLSGQQRNITRRT
jgi:hypothetical protein